jgi:hypothetical protein
MSPQEKVAVKNAIIGELEARDQLSLGAKEGCTYIVDSRVKMKVAITSSAERADHDEGIEAKKLQTLSTTDKPGHLRLGSVRRHVGLDDGGELVLVLRLGRDGCLGDGGKGKQ